MEYPQKTKQSINTKLNKYGSLAPKKNKHQAQQMPQRTHTLRKKIIKWRIITSNQELEGDQVKIYYSDWEKSDII